MTEEPSRPAYDLADPTTLTLDLTNAKPKEVLALQKAFNEVIRTNPDLGPLPVHEGWNEITPAIATNLLLRNPPGANRWLNGTKAIYLANQMANNDWKATGQPILTDTDEKLADAQHRLYGVIISGAIIRSYVVTGVEPGLFAYIDNTTGRSAKDALQTAGFNGVAAVIVNIVKFAEKVRRGLFDRSSGVSSVPPFSPADVMRLSRNYPNIEMAARSASSDWENVTELLYNRKDVVGYVGMRIIDEHDDDIANTFFEDILHTSDGASEYAVAFHKEIEKDAAKDKPMLKQHSAAMLIKVFNAWLLQENLGRRWMPTVTEDFPAVEKSEPQAQAAE